MEAIQIHVNGRDYIAKADDHIDQVFYHIYDGETFLFVIGLNENAVWESVEDVDQQLVQTIGNQIESITM